VTLETLLHETYWPYSWNLGEFWLPWGKRLPSVKAAF
jgi:hypothetical protein